MHCLDCDYPLKKLRDNRCPECGRAFDSRDPTTFRPLAASERRREAIREIKGTLAACGILVLIGGVWLIADLFWINNSAFSCGCCYLWLALLGFMIGLWRVIRAWQGFYPGG